MILVLMPLGLSWSSNVGAFEEPRLVEVCPKRACLYVRVLTVAVPWPSLSACDWTTVVAGGSEEVVG